MTTHQQQPSTDENADCARGTILILEDDPDLMRLFTKTLRGDGHHVIAATDLATCETLLAAHTPDIILSDINLASGTSINFLTARAAELEARGVITITMSADSKYRHLTEDLGAFIFVQKPLAPRDMATLVGRLITHKRAMAAAADSRAS